MTTLPFRLGMLYRRLWLSFFLGLLFLSQSVDAQPNGVLWEQIPRPADFLRRPPNLEEYFNLNDLRQARFPVTEIDIFPSPEILSMFREGDGGQGLDVGLRIAGGESGTGSFGLALRGFLVPPVSGEYVFSLATDDGGVLYLNPDGEDSRNVIDLSRVRISAQREFDRPTATRQVSEPVTLEAGERHYIEVITHELTGNSHVSVQWRRPDGIAEIIPLEFLQPLPPSFEVEWVAPVEPVFVREAMATSVEFAVEGSLKLIETASLLVDGEVVNQETRGFFEGFDRFTLSQTMELTWPSPVVGEHQLELEVVDVLGVRTRSVARSVTVTPDCAGLIGEYFSGAELVPENRIGAQVDATLDYRWSTGAGPSIFTGPAFLPAEGYSVRWQGFLLPDRDGIHQLRTQSDDGVRVWVDEELLIDDWEPDAQPDAFAEVLLEAGRYHAVRVEYRHVSGPESLVRLLWSPPNGGPEEIIPARHLFYCEDLFPRVRLPQPFSGERLPFGDAVLVEAAAEGVGDDVDRVEFFVDGVLLGQSAFLDPQIPFSFFWNGASVGDHEVWAVAFDTSGRRTESRHHRVEITEDLPQCLSEVVRTSFETGVGSDWSVRQRSATPIGGRQFLGPRGAHEIRLRLDQLETHTQVLVEFDVYVLRSWDGFGPDGSSDETFRVRLDDGQEFVYAFANGAGPGPDAGRQSFPNLVGEDANHPPQTGASEVQSLGYFYGLDRVPTQPLDAVYRIRLPLVEHTADSLTVVVSGQGQETLADESWGLDNVLVRAVETSTPPELVAPVLDQNALVGGETGFDVVVRAAGQLSYQWEKNGVPIPGAVRASLILTDLTEADAGRYTVLVSNCSGQVRSNVATLSVRFPNREPSLAGLPEAIVIQEDAGETIIPFQVLDPEDDPNQLSVTVVNGSDGIVTADVLSFGGEGSDRFVRLEFPQDQFGQGELRVRVVDPAGLAAEQTVPVRVEPVNDAPTVDPLPDVAYTEGEVFPTIQMTGIGSGAPNETDTLAVAVQLSEPGLFSDPEVRYVSPQSVGELILQPRPDTFGSSEVSVTVTDGASENGATTVTFSVVVAQRPNELPTVELLSPADGSQFEVGDEVSVAIQASDPDGELVSATLLIDGAVVDQSSTQPFSFVWLPTEAGDFTVQVSVMDDRGGLVASQVHLLDVIPANQAPELDPVLRVEVNEDAVPQVIPLVIRDDRTLLADLDVQVIPDESGVIEMAVRYETALQRWELEVTPVPDQNGEVSYQVSVTDEAGLSAARTGAFGVISVNDPPTLLPLARVVFFQGTTEHEVTLQGIGTGAANEEQTLVVSATSSDLLLLPAPQVNYESPNPTGILRLEPIAGAFGEAEVTVEVTDGGLENGSVIQRFPVVIERLPNVLPTASLQIAGTERVRDEGETIRITVTAEDSDGTVERVEILVNGAVVETLQAPPYSFDWVATPLGEAVIEARVTDDRGGVTVAPSRTLSIVKPNEAPRVTVVERLELREDAGVQVMALVVTDDFTALDQLDVRASAFPEDLLDPSSLVVGFEEGAWQVGFGLVRDAFGEGRIEVRVGDEAGLVTMATTVVVVESVNDAPTIDALDPVVILEDTEPFEVRFAGVTSGARNELDPLEVRAVSGNAALIPNPEVMYTSPAEGGGLILRPVPDRSGTAEITVVVSDGQSVNGETRVPFLVTVEAVPNQAPTLTWVSPSEGSVVELGQTVPLEVRAADADGQVRDVAFEINGQPFRTVTVAPYRVEWEPETSGAFRVQATVRDDEGESVSAIRSVTVVEPAPSLEVVLTLPRDRGVFCPDAAIQFAATLAGPVEEVTEVAFYAGETLLGSDQQPPYQYLWDSPLVGDFVVTARAITRTGETVISAVSSIGVSEDCGDVVLVRGGGGDEVDVLQEYLFEMGLASTVLEAEQVDESLVANTQLVVVSLGSDGNISAALLDLLTAMRDQPRASGMPLPIYVLGSHLTTQTEGLGENEQVRWLDLIGLEGGQGGANGGLVEIFDSVDGFELMSGRFGELMPFDYDLPIEDAVVRGEADIVAISGGSDVAVVQPPFNNFDFEVTRVLAQNFLPVAGGDRVSVLERKRFFQNSVCWLIRCARCTNVDLPLQILQDSRETELGRSFEVGLRLVNNGACEASAAQVVADLPPALEVEDVAFTQGLDWTFRPEDGQLIVNLGRVGRGDPAAVEVTVRLVPVRPGEVTYQFCSRSNNTIENCRDFAVSIAGVLPPKLALVRVSATELELQLDGDVGVQYVIEQTRDLVTWRAFETTNDPQWRGRIPATSELASGGVFYRAVVRP